VSVMFATNFYYSHLNIKIGISNEFNDYCHCIICIVFFFGCVKI